MSKNEQLKDEILEELKWDPRVDESKIGVAVSDAVVTLMGHVSSFPAKVAACEAVHQVKGVKAIADEIEVRLPSNEKYDDEDVAEKVANVMTWNVSVPDDSIKANVRDGVVSLSGEVDWQFQRKNLVDAVRHIRGVKSITNLVTIRPRVSSNDISKEIKRALHRNANLESRQIEVTVDNGKVTLDGKVHAYYEKGLIQSAVWQAPGVTKVIDHLEVA